MVGRTGDASPRVPRGGYAPADCSPQIVSYRPVQHPLLISLMTRCTMHLPAIAELRVDVVQISVMLKGLDIMKARTN